MADKKISQLSSYSPINDKVIFPMSYEIADNKFKTGHISAKDIKDYVFTYVNENIDIPEIDLSSYAKTEDLDTLNVKTENEITIAGGPLASQFKTAFGNTLPAGTTLQDILSKLVCVELFPSVSKQTASITLSNVAPSISGVTSNGLYFVDSTHNIVVTPKSAAFSSEKDSTISGLTNGYFYANGTDEDGKTTYAFNSSTSTKKDIVYSLTKQSDLYCKKSDGNGADSGYTTYAASGTTLPGAKTIACKTKLGTNKVEAYSDNASGKYSCEAVSEVWPKSNLGNMGATSYSVAAVAETTLNATTDKAASLSWKGVYPVAYGTGSVTGLFTATEGSVLTRTFTAETAVTRAIIQFPGDRNITKIEQNTTLGWQGVADFDISDTAISYGGVDYKQMTLGGNPNTAGSFELRFTFDKALNS